MNKKLRCKQCREYFPREDMLKLRFGAFCTKDHAAIWGLEKSRKDQVKARKKKEAEFKNKEKIVKREKKQKLDKFKKETMTRTEWYNRLQDLINQWVVKVRDVDEPCCTCGTTSPHIKYDAGHHFTRKARPDIRFELTQLHKQCSIQCNVHGSGMRPEYKEFIIKKYGQDHYDWLEQEKPLLKDQFPHWTDIENEMIKWRKILRENDIKPRW